ncbi:MAG TPA: hypothetical protein VNI84_20415 [Pyrinomonadaceae bacterium]|nr:hypothetical protein [Pyrinomonadaceae bacterium]
MVCMLVVSFCFAPVAFGQEETMTNDEVITLAGAGLNKSIIVNKIKTSKTNFDLSTDALIKLKKAGISDEIVTAMLEAKSGKSMAAINSGGSAPAMNGDPNDPLAPHGFGLYLYEEKNGVRKMTQLAPNVSAQNRTGGGFTAAVTPFGLGKRKTKANLPGTTANLQLKEANPVFYFHLDVKSGGLNTSSGIPSTPSEFALVRFNVRDDNREVTIAKSNAYSSKGGLSDEYVVNYTAEDLGNGIFKVTPKTTLTNGEYGFYLLNSGNSNASAAIGSKFFDFGVRLQP